MLYNCPYSNADLFEFIHRHLHHHLPAETWLKRKPWIARTRRGRAPLWMEMARQQPSWPTEMMVLPTVAAAAAMEVARWRSRLKWVYSMAALSSSVRSLAPESSCLPLECWSTRAASIWLSLCGSFPVSSRWWVLLGRVDKALAGQWING